MARPGALDVDTKSQNTHIISTHSLRWQRYGVCERPYPCLHLPTESTASLRSKPGRLLQRKMYREHHKRRHKRVEQGVSPKVETLHKNRFKCSILQPLLLPTRSLFLHLSMLPPRPFLPTKLLSRQMVMQQDRSKQTKKSPNPQASLTVPLQVRSRRSHRSAPNQRLIAFLLPLFLYRPKVLPVLGLPLTFVGLLLFYQTTEVPLHSPSI